VPALRIKDWLILAASRGADFLSEKRVSGICKTEKPLMQLLVSVRDAREATDALDGGAAIIDVKEPARGSLGAADPECWRQVAQVVGGRVPLSIALGELRDIQPDIGDRVVSEVDYAKVGLAGCCGLADWFIRWREVARRLRETAPVAVVYADWKTCGSPPPEQILAAARKLGCPALLCDTHDKQSGGLFDHLDRDTILSLSEAVRCAGMMFALAGSLELRHLDLLMQCRPDYVAVRGAACAGNRLGTIQRDKVRALVDQLSATSCP
jgi:uncharacterized protein (UPF0264 family)